MNNANIILVGFMGTGKSTVGQAIATSLGKVFVDTDKEIERKADMVIPQLFTEFGERHFRKLESEVIKEVMGKKDQIIATGGGAVLAEHNRVEMINSGYVVALTAKADVIIERLRRDQNRPLIVGDVEKRVQTLLMQRHLAYDFANLSIDTSDLEIGSIIRQIITAYQVNKMQKGTKF